MHNSQTQINSLTVRNYQFEDVLIGPIVKSENELIEIDLKVLSGDTMVDTDNCSFEQGPEVFHAHRVDVTVDERLGMANGFMPSATCGLGIALEFIGNEQFSTDANEGIKERGESIGFEVLDDLGHYIPASLLEPHDNLFAGSTTATFSTGLLAADVSVVGFNDTAELVFEPIPWPHGLAYLHTHSPSSFVGDSKGSLKLFGGDTFLGVTHQPDRCKPFLKRCSATMEDRAGGHRELIGAVAATPYPAGGNPVRLGSAATRTGNAFGPALGAKEDLALVLGGEPFLKVDDIHA